MFQSSVFDLCSAVQRPVAPRQLRFSGPAGDSALPVQAPNTGEVTAARLVALLHGRFPQGACVTLVKAVRECLARSPGLGASASLQVIEATLQSARWVRYPLRRHEMYALYLLLQHGQGDTGHGSGAQPDRPALVLTSSLIEGAALQFSVVSREHGRQGRDWVLRQRSRGLDSWGRTIETLHLHGVPDGAEAAVHFDMTGVLS
jgi:hypothetical protein